MSTTPKRTTTIGRLGAAAVNLLLVVAALFGLGLVVPHLLGYERYVITGGSMTGTIAKGSVVFDEVVPAGELKVGDVITYRPPAATGVVGLVTHRIIAIDRTPGKAPVLRTKGDANADADPWRFQLTGTTQPVVAHAVPYVGEVFIALADRRMRMLLIGIPAAVIALLALGEIVRGLRGERTPDAAAPQPAAS